MFVVTADVLTVRVCPAQQCQVAYQDGAETIHLGARSATGQPIDRDSRVRIERVASRVAIVRPISGAVGGGR